MTRDAPQDDGLLLPGLDGANPLAFLAALGTLRTLTLARPETNVRMRWRRHQGAWRPQIHSDHGTSPSDSFVEVLNAQLRTMHDHPAFALGDNLNVAPEVFAQFAREAVADAGRRLDEPPPHRRAWADFAAAFGCEAMVTEQAKAPVIQDTGLRTMSGAGHQHFLKFFRTLVAATEAEHVRSALFEPWRYSDEGRGLNLRWDPADDRRYALRWKDPSTDPATCVRGANRLAIEGLPLLPTAPSRSRLHTTAMVAQAGGGICFVWPIWTPLISMDACRSVLALPDLTRQLDDPSARSQRKARGIVAMYRSERITVGKFRNFTPAEAV